jgi:hypothetical protein
MVFRIAASAKRSTSRIELEFQVNSNFIITMARRNAISAVPRFLLRLCPISMNSLSNGIVER